MTQEETSKKTQLCHVYVRNIIINFAMYIILMIFDVRRLRLDIPQLYSITFIIKTRGKRSMPGLRSLTSIKYVEKTCIKYLENVKC